MITVDIELVCIPLKNGNEYYHYEKFNVYGHANDGTINSIKCCAGVTAILLGLSPQLISEKKVVLEKGKFEYGCNSMFTKQWDTQTDYALNCAVYQLWEVYKMYPSLFKSFNIKEIKGEYENDYERNIRNQVNRNSARRKSTNCKIKKMDFCSCCEK